MPPSIHCAYDELFPLTALKPHPRNPNTHPKDQLKLFAKILTTTGWRRPIVLSRQSGCIIKGHGAWLAAATAGLTHCPVTWQDYPEPDTEIQDLIADNELARHAVLDQSKLAEAIEQLRLAEIDLELAGFLQPTRQTADLNHADKWEILIDCRDAAHQTRLLNSLRELGIQAAPFPPTAAPEDSSPSPASSPTPPTRTPTPPNSSGSTKRSSITRAGAGPSSSATAAATSSKGTAPTPPPAPPAGRKSPSSTRTTPAKPTNSPTSSPTTSSRAKAGRRKTPSPNCSTN